MFSAMVSTRPVPGWTATYWVKHLSSIRVVASPFDGFWVRTAYRLPQGAFPMRERFASQDTAANTPITEIMINSLVTNIEEGQRFRAGETVDVRGIAWDAGHGIDRVEISTDGGRLWRPAKLGSDAGRFSWRQWQYPFVPAGAGNHGVMVRATNRLGDTQGSQWIQNPAGYHHNLVQTLGIVVA